LAGKKILAGAACPVSLRLCVQFCLGQGIFYEPAFIPSTFNCSKICGILKTKIFEGPGKEPDMKFRKRLSFVFVLAAMVLCASWDLSAQIIDGNKLLGDMREFEKAENNDITANHQQAYFFIGYVTGVYDSSDDVYFYPAKPTIAQVCSIVSRHLKDHLDKLNGPADLLIIDALRKAFPKK
jgi:hypothetical protein